MSYFSLEFSDLPLKRYNFPSYLLGNKAFSFCGFPVLWSWQIVWWILGIVIMWALCFKAEMSTTSEEQIRRAEEENMIVAKKV